MKKKIKHLKWIMATFLAFFYLQSTGQTTSQEKAENLETLRTWLGGCIGKGIFSLEYNQMMTELRSRERIGSAANSPLSPHSSDCLLKMKYLLDALYGNGLSLEDLKKALPDNFDNPESQEQAQGDTNPNDQLPAHKAQLIQKLLKNLQIDDDDNRELVTEKNTMPSIVKLAERGAVGLVMPTDSKYGRVEGFRRGHHPLRDELRSRLSGDLREDSKFRNEYVLPLGTRTCIIVDGRWAITAGHGLKMHEKQWVLKDFWELTSPYDSLFHRQNFSSAEVVHVEYGSAHTPDFAILKLKRRFKKSGLSLDELKPPKMNIDTSTQLVVLGHPLGMNMITDNKGKFMDYPADHWESAPYFFANLDVNSGNSGSPVFVHDPDSTEEDTTRLGLIGMVVGSGGLDDFHCESGRCRWLGPTEEQAVGARVLKIAAVLPTLHALMGLKPAPIAPSTHGQPARRPHLRQVEPVNLADYNVTIKGEQIVFTPYQNANPLPPHKPCAITIDQTGRLQLDGLRGEIAEYLRCSRSSAFKQPTDYKYHPVLHGHF